MREFKETIAGGGRDDHDEQPRLAAEHAPSKPE
jgi:hypothetical protein